MRLKMMMAGLAMGCCTLAAGAQISAPKPAAAALGVPADPAKSIDKMLSLYEGEAMGVVNAMPAEKYDFAPSAGTVPGSKFEGVRTFAQQATHVAQANYYFFSSISGIKPDVNMKAFDTMTKKEDIVAALAASFKFGHKAIATITPANAFLTIKPIDDMDTRATLATFAVAHGYDHYGQMVEYLRMNGVVPPGSK